LSRSARQVALARAFAGLEHEPESDPPGTTSTSRTKTCSQDWL